METSELVGMTMATVENSGDELLMETVDGRRFRFFHEQECCEGVSIEDVHGDLADLVGSPILHAEESTNRGDDQPSGVGYGGTWTWTFYRFVTNKGSVQIRWLGTSSGYYSESVDLEEIR